MDTSKIKMISMVIDRSGITWVVVITVILKNDEMWCYDGHMFTWRRVVKPEFLSQE